MSFSKSGNNNKNDKGNVDAELPDDDPSAQKRKIKEQEPKAGSSVWLISFTDVMALMLTFFVLLFSMSRPDIESFKDLSEAIKNQLKSYYGKALNRGFQDTISLEKVDFNRALNLNYLKSLIETLLQEEESLNNVSLISMPGGLILSFPENLLFEAGEYELSSEGARALYTLGLTLSRIKNRIEIVGHADPTPISTLDYPSNWELSATRAAEVAAALKNFGYKRDILIRGQSSGRFDDLPDTISLDQKFSLARRVDVLIREDDGQLIESFITGIP